MTASIITTISNGDKNFGSGGGVFVLFVCLVGVFFCLFVCLFLMRVYAYVYVFTSPCVCVALCILNLCSQHYVQHGLQTAPYALRDRWCVCFPGPGLPDCGGEHVQLGDVRRLFSLQRMGTVDCMQRTLLLRHGRVRRWDSERERERERESMCVCVCVCVCVRARACVYEYVWRFVCVLARECVWRCVCVLARVSARVRDERQTDRDRHRDRHRQRQTDRQTSSSLSSS